MQNLLVSGLSISFFSFILIFQNKKNKISKFYALLLICFLSLPVLYKYIEFYIPFKFPYIYFTLIRSYPFVYGVLLYFYSKAVIVQNFKFKRKYLLHFLPFILITFITFIPGDRYIKEALNTILNMSGVESFEKYKMLNAALNKSFFYMIIGFLNILSFVIYSTLIFMELKKHKKDLYNEYSYESIYLNHKWINYINIYFILSYLLILLLSFFKIMFFSGYTIPADLFQGIFLNFFIIIFSYFSLKEIYFYIPQKTDNIKKEEKTIKKYQKSGLSDNDLERIINKITNILNEQKLYLSGTFSLDDLSDNLSVTKHYLTQAINQKGNKNFYSLINEYRITEAKRLLTENTSVSIIDIAYQSGFNSKSAFNKSFKQLTGQTPSEYKKNNNKKL